MMKKEKIKVYIYTRVSTAMQIDGYSLDAQKSRMKAYAEFNDYEIVGEYEDAGKSGKSIEGRVEFNRMMEDIKSGKDGVSYVLVFKLSRFGRNAADVLSTLQVMQDFGVNLICVEDGIDSSKDAGKLMISVLSAVAEIERENIRVQTMEGRIQKAREGKWNGGFAPYGYRLEKGQLFINEEEAAAIRVIFDQYVHGYRCKRSCKIPCNPRDSQNSKAKRKKSLIRCSTDPQNSKKSGILRENRLWQTPDGKGAWHPK